ncbi:hypothetical protein FJZ26_06370 [Candidatus Parvarchaeota archaeon]|nr:hypothetical protein [Candidatus Parvarchaeota archaeon]
MKKGQISVESLTLVGFMLAFMVPVVLLFLTISNVSSENVSIGQARITGKQIANAAGEVYAQGNGTRRIILVNYPPNMQNITLNNHTIAISLRTAKGIVDVVENTFARTTDGDLPLSNSTRLGSGLKSISIVSKGSHVEIGYSQ